jgi:hypothetical protein
MTADSNNPPEWLIAALDQIAPVTGFGFPPGPIEGATYDTWNRMIVSTPDMDDASRAARLEEWKRWRAGEWDDALPESQQGKSA